MKIGVIGRADQRGIAYQSDIYIAGLRPAKVLCVMMNDRRWPEDTGKFGRHSTTFVNWDAAASRLDEQKVRRFLSGLDVVLAVETLYDWRMADWAREMGVRTVIHGNPEFYCHHHHPHWPRPDRWIWPTSWLQDELPEEARGPIVPIPVAPKRLAADPGDEPLRVLHVAGHAAVGDRNGTLEFMGALENLRTNVRVTVVSQDGGFPPARPSRHVTLVEHPRGVTDRWEMYRDQHLVVLPRHYGGLCLPALEAMASGCAVAMTDCIPNREWPVFLMRPRPGRAQRTKFGAIQTWTTHPKDIAQTIDQLNKNRGRLMELQTASERWAEAHTWKDIRHLYDEALG